jgi:hypothetical protein
MKNEKIIIVLFALISGTIGGVSAATFSDKKAMNSTGFVWILYDCIEGTATRPKLLQPDLREPQPYVPDGSQYVFCEGGTAVYCAVKYYYSSMTNSSSQLLYNESNGEFYFNPNFPGGANAAMKTIVYGVVYCGVNGSKEGNSQKTLKTK